MPRLALLVLILTAPQAWPYAEDSVLTSTQQTKNAAHYDMVLAFGRCLGLGATARTIANYSQATDSGTFSGVTVTFTSRAGANNLYFHVPQNVTNALGELLLWSQGFKSIPAGLSLTMSQTREVASLAGTAGAFGIYLHALGDSYSHQACTDAGYVPHCDGPFPECETDVQEEFCGLDAHTNEWGPQDSPLTRNAKRGLEELYKAMASYAGASTTIPANVQSAIDSFSIQTTGAARVSVASALCPR